MRKIKTVSLNTIYSRKTPYNDLSIINQNVVKPLNFLKMKIPKICNFSYKNKRLKNWKMLKKFKMEK